MLYREIIAVCSEIHTKHINSLCGQKVKQPFCHELSNSQQIVLFPAGEPFSATTCVSTSRCTVSSSTDCRNPTLHCDYKQCAFWNIANRWIEVHGTFCAVTVQHGTFRTVTVKHGTFFIVTVQHSTFCAVTVQHGTFCAVTVQHTHSLCLQSHRPSVRSPKHLFISLSLVYMS
jgi:hypothetical protein